MKPAKQAFPMDEIKYAEMVVADTPEGDLDIDDEDFDFQQTHNIDSSKLSNANMCGNTSGSDDATKSNTMEVKKLSNRLWRQNDEPAPLKSFKANQLTSKYGIMESRYQNIISRMKRRSFTFRDSHQRKLLEASSKLRKENNGGVKRDELSTEGKEGKDFYPSLLRNYLADRGLHFASLDHATQNILVEDWNVLMLARSACELLNAKFDKTVYECTCNVYEASVKHSTTPQDS